jgi:hypothetical protein
MQSIYACRRSLIGDRLDILMRLDSWVPEIGYDMRAGLLLLLHLCDPAQYSADTAVMACTALVVLIADGYSAHAHHTPEEMRLIGVSTAFLHCDGLIAAMQHDGFAAALAEQRRDAIAVLAAALYRDPTDEAGALQEDRIRANQKMFDAFAPSAVQVSASPIAAAALRANAPLLRSFHPKALLHWHMQQEQQLM